MAAAQRRVIETSVARADAYAKCFKRATQMGWDVSVNVKGQRLVLSRVERSPGWWCAVIFGFLFYIIPGILVLLLWSPKHECQLVFEEDAEITSIVAMLQGKEAVVFFNEISGMLS
ncbi:MAG: hypothetical protein ACRCT8_03210 [Lacipirellulaceae bacterium]